MPISAAKALVSLGIACAYCGDDASTLDHIVAQSEFRDYDRLAEILGLSGPDDPRNLAPACHSCNTSKKDIEVSMWLRRCMAEGLGLHAPSPARMRVLRAIRASTCASWVAELASSALRDMIADLDREREMMGR